ncbi:MAG: RDD family protein [Pelovirga sp.]
MKCPKCGYNSFDYLDSCKKCGKDLLEFKQRYGIRSVLLPGAMKETAPAPSPALELPAVEEFPAAAAAGAATAAGVAASTMPVDGSASSASGSSADGDDFGFDFMGDSSEEEDLSFDELFEEAPEDEDVEESLEAPKGAPAASEDAGNGDVFAFDLADEDEEDDTAIVFEDEEENDRENSPKGSGEGPSSPFDLPESAPQVGAPETAKAEQATTGRDAGPANLESVIPAGWAVVPPVPPDDPAADDAPGVAAAEAADQPRCASAVLRDMDEAAVAAPVAVSAGSLGGRCVSVLYDVAVLLLVGLSFIVAAEISMATGSGPLPTLETLIDLSVPYFLVLFFLTFGYFTLFHFLAGQTPGKMLTGLRVETITGEPLGFSQAFLRSVGGLLQLLPLGVGYLLILTRSDRRGWNDRLAGTRVVVVSEP